MQQFYQQQTYNHISDNQVLRYDKNSIKAYRVKSLFTQKMLTNLKWKTKPSTSVVSFIRSNDQFKIQQIVRVRKLCNTGFGQLQVIQICKITNKK